MSQFVVRAHGAWSRVPAVLKLGLGALLIVILVLLNALPAFARDVEWLPFRW